MIDSKRTIFVYGRPDGGFEYQTMDIEDRGRLTGDRLTVKTTGDISFSQADPRVVGEICELADSGYDLIFGRTPCGGKRPLSNDAKKAIGKRLAEVML